MGVGWGSLRVWWVCCHPGDGDSDGGDWSTERHGGDCACDCDHGGCGLLVYVEITTLLPLSRRRMMHCVRGWFVSTAESRSGVLAPCVESLVVERPS